jgi:hypothetical protein
MQFETMLITRIPRLQLLRARRTNMELVPRPAKSSRSIWLFEAWAVLLLRAMLNVLIAAELLLLEYHSAWDLRPWAFPYGWNAASPTLGPLWYWTKCALAGGSIAPLCSARPEGCREFEVVVDLSRLRDTRFGGRRQPGATPAVQAVNIYM